MELFSRAGCLTDEGLKGLVEGTLDEMQRMEAAEHLSFCDECLVRYTQLLTDDVLIVPDETLTPTIMKRVKTKAVQIFFNRYTRIAAALALAMMLWSIGTFDIFLPEPGKHRLNIPEQPTEPPVAAVQQIWNAVESAQQKFFSRVQNMLTQDAPKENR